MTTIATHSHQLYRGDAVDLTSGIVLSFERKDLEVIESFETVVIAQALDGKQYSISYAEWASSYNRKPKRD